MKYIAAALNAVWKPSLKSLWVYILKLCLFIGLCIGLEQAIKLKTHGFCLQRILATDIVSQEIWQTPALGKEEQKEIEALLSQPYTLIGAGSECFAFASKDGKAVIKFFKLNHFRPVLVRRGIFIEDQSPFAGTLSNHPWTRLSLPSPFHERLKRFLGIREFRIKRTFDSIKLAYDNLKEETGLIYLHLNPTNTLNKTLTLYDGSGIAHQIDLDQARFFLQKKATPLRVHFKALQKKGGHKQAQETIDSLLKLILSRCKKGFSDRDLILRNLGAIDTQVIEIDSGSFDTSPQMRQPWIYTQEIFYATRELRSWFKKNYPEMIPYLEKKVAEEIHCHEL